MPDIFDQIGTETQEMDEDIFDQIGTGPSMRTEATRPGVLEGMVSPYVRGFKKAVAGSNKLVANMAGLFEYAGNKVAEVTGLPKGMAATAVKDWAEQNVKDWTPEALENQGMIDQIIEGTTEGVLRLPEYAGFVKYLGPVGGFAAHGAVSEADKGLGAAAMGAARGAATGALFEVTKPLAPVARALAVGGPTAAATAMEGGSVSDVISSGVTMGLMAGTGQRGGLKIRDAFKSRLKGRTGPEMEIEAPPIEEGLPVKEEFTETPRTPLIDRPLEQRPIDQPIPPGPPPPEMGLAGEGGPPPPVTPRPPFMTEVYQNEARRLGLTFNGLQPQGKGEPLPLFTDPETGSTFAIRPTENVTQGLMRARARFRPKEGQAEGQVPPRDIIGRDVFDEISGTPERIPVRERAEVEGDIAAGKGVPFEELQAYPDLARGKEEAPFETGTLRKAEAPAVVEAPEIGRPGPELKQRLPEEMQSLKDQVYDQVRRDPKKIVSPEYTAQALMRAHDLPLEQAREISDQVRERIIEREKGKIAGAFKRLDKLEAAGENPKLERARLLRIKNNLLTLGLTPKEAEAAFAGRGRYKKKAEAPPLKGEGIPSRTEAPEIGQAEAKTEAPLAPIPVKAKRILQPFQAKTLLSWTKAQGGIWDDSLPGEIKALRGPESGVIGLISKKNGKAFDELTALAKDYGWIDSEATASDFIELLNRDIRAAKQGKERIKNLRKDLDEGVIKQLSAEEAELGEWADELTKEGWSVYGPHGEERVGNIAKGDKVLINNDQYTHIGFDPQGRAVLKDGETLRLDVFDKIPVEAIKPGSGQTVIGEGQETTYRKPLNPAEEALFKDIALHYEKEYGIKGHALQEALAILRGIDFQTSFDFSGRPGKVSPTQPKGQAYKIAGHGFSRELIWNGSANYKGQKITQPADLAVMAQVFRNPKFETLRVFFTKKDEIVGHIGLTSRLPGQVAMTKGHSESFWAQRLIPELKTKMRRLDADGFWLVHNHPTGKTDASNADKAVHQRLDADLGYRLKGGIIINGNTYGLIQRVQKGNYFQIESSVHALPRGHRTGSLDPLLTPSVNHPIIGKSVHFPQDLVALASDLKHSPDVVSLFYIGADMKVRAIQEVPMGLFKHYNGMVNYFRGRLREFGSTNVVPVFPENSSLSPMVRDNIRTGIRHQKILDAVQIGKEKTARGMDPRLEQVPAEDFFNTETIKSFKVAEDNQAIFKEATQPRPGPGAQTAGSGVRETPSDIVQLSQSLDAVTSPKEPISVRIKKALDVTTKAGAARDSVSAAFERVKATGAAIYQGWRRPAEWTQFKDMLGDYLLTNQQSSFENHHFAKKITQQIPSKVKREALVNYIQAGGDTELLRVRARDSEPRFKPGYEEALKLNADEKRFADNVGNYFDSKLQEAVENGMVRHGVENYVSQLYDKGDPRYQSIMAEIDAGLLKKDPYFIKKRIFKDYFEAEQAGLVPKDKDIGFLLSAYDQAFNEAIASRTFIRTLMEGKASDGRPLADISGFGKVIQVPEGTDTGGIIVKPKAHPKGTNDYRVIDHPALREWKWLTEDPLSDPVMLEGEMLIHPEIYRHLKNVLSKSKIQQHPVGRATLRTIQEFKSTLLSASGFHQTQETLHAIFHRVNPAKIGKIDFSDPVQRGLVKHGLMVSEHGGMEYFSDGLHASGLINKIPGIGHFSRNYGEYLFRDYIPRLKMRMAQEALERNFQRYRGKLTDDQIYAMTANQANAAFGELNYKAMGRSKTTQDILRIMCLAPDFLEARARFVGQALKPYGREQSAALIRGALGMYIGARVLNYLIGDDPQWDKPFSIVVKGKEYGLRSVPGDIIHLLHNPQSFVYWRLNPTTVRTAVEWATGRNARGQKVSNSDQVKEFFTTHMPIPLQGLIKGGGGSLVDSILASFGLTSWKNRSKAERLISDINFEKISKAEKDPRQKAIGLLRMQFFREYEKTRQIPETVKKAVRAGQVGSAQVVDWMKAAEKPALQRGFEHLSVEEAAKVWEVARTEEKRMLAPIYIKKIKNRMKAVAQGKTTLMPDWKAF